MNPKALALSRSTACPSNSIARRFLRGCGFWLVLLRTMAAGLDTNHPVIVSMPDGQVLTHLISVRVNRDLTWDQQPRLFLHFSHALTDPLAGEGDGYSAIELSREHAWAEPVRLGSGPPKDASSTGTLVLFSLRGLETHWFKPVVRVRPVLEWMDASGKRVRYAGTREIYLGNMVSAIVLSGIASLVLLSIIPLISWYRTRGTPTYRLCAAVCNSDGSLSLWRTQLALWTFAIAWMVMLYGFLKLEVPEIPEPLVALMGLSLLTGGASATRAPNLAVRSTTSTGATGASGATGGQSGGVEGSPSLSAVPAAASVVPEGDRDPTGHNRLRTRPGDLITIFNRKANRAEISIAKVQMLIWTLVTLALFVTKSLLDGVLWPVPWQLVALMGMSQAGYVVPKFFEEEQR